MDAGPKTARRVDALATRQERGSARVVPSSVRFRPSPASTIAWMYICFIMTFAQVACGVVAPEGDEDVRQRPTARTSSPALAGPGTAASPDHVGGGSQPTGTPTTRDPSEWPYPWDSIWNMPLGHDADLVPFQMTIPTERTLNVEEDLVVARSTTPGRPIFAHDAAWEDGVTRCGRATDTILLHDMPVPPDWTTDPGYHGAKPNHAAAIVMPDHTLVETQPLHVCADGTVTSQFTNPSWQGDSILTGGHGPPRGGAHGGSFMTAFGGTIRLGEWVPDGQIPHVVKFETYSRDNLWNGGSGFRWPAMRADAGYRDKYRGTVSDAVMGSLLAVPPDFDVDGLVSEPARILGRALQSYGAYIVDGTGWSTAAFAVEWGPDGRVLDEFRRVWGFPMVGDVTSATGDQRAFLEDVLELYGALHVVADNDVSQVGGAGARLAPWAPPFEDGTGGYPG